MLNKLTLATAALAAISFASKAEAAPSWHLSEPVGAINGFCNDIGVRSQVGYYGETSPRVGHTQDPAVVVVVKAGCGPITAIPDFRLPAGVVARDTSQSVVCVKVLADGVTRQPLTNTSSSGCSNVALPNPNNYQNVYGWSALAPGETLEVYLPVIWLRPFFNTLFHAAVQTNIAVVTPSIGFNVDSGARFENFSITQNTAGTEAYPAFTLYNFYNAGDVAIEYSTSPTFGIGTMVSAPVTASGAYEYYPSFSVTMHSLTPATTYYWRARIITAVGTFRGATQSFKTNAQLLNPNPPPSIPYPCRYRFCS